MTYRYKKSIHIIFLVSIIVSDSWFFKLHISDLKRPSYSLITWVVNFYESNFSTEWSLTHKLPPLLFSILHFVSSNELPKEAMVTYQLYVLFHLTMDGYVFVLINRNYYKGLCLPSGEASLECELFFSLWTKHFLPTG